MNYNKALEFIKSKKIEFDIEYDKLLQERRNINKRLDEVYIKSLRTDRILAALEKKIIENFYYCNKCGFKTAELKMNSVTFGHGIYGSEFWIECHCGAKTEKIHNYGRTDMSVMNELRCIWRKTDV